jgi:hypothetical protein
LYFLSLKAMTTKEELLKLIEELPERGLEEALEEVRSIHAFWVGISPGTVVATGPTSKRITGHIRKLELRPPIVYSED